MFSKISNFKRPYLEEKSKLDENYLDSGLIRANLNTLKLCIIMRVKKKAELYFQKQNFHEVSSFSILVQKFPKLKIS